MSKQNESTIENIQDKKQIMNLEMTELECRKNVLRTITSMLVTRGWLNYTFSDELRQVIYNDEFNKYHNILIKNGDELLDSTFIDCINKKVAIKFYGSKLNTFKNDREIDSFTSKYATAHKILIVNNISPKAEKQAYDTSNFEVFKLNSVIVDISRHVCVPTHILLTNEEAKSVLDEYKLKPQDMGRIFEDDPMAKFLYARKNDIIQIRRATTSSGITTYYRIVVSGSILA